MGKQIILIAAGVAALILLVLIIKKRNEFERLRRAVKAEGSNISIYKEKRDDCLRDALGIAKINYRHEADIIATLTKDDQLNQLAYLGQRCPDLQSSAGYLHVIRQAAVWNDDVAAARVLLTSNITEYNNAISRFPDSIVAALCGYREEKLIDEENLAKHRTLKNEEVDVSSYY